MKISSKIAPKVGEPVTFITENRHFNARPAASECKVALIKVVIFRNFYDPVKAYVSSLLGFSRYALRVN
jgi:hypothetical protein